MNKVPFGRATLGMNIVYITFTQEDSRLGENVALLLLSCFDTRSISRGNSILLEYPTFVGGFFMFSWQKEKKKKIRLSVHCIDTRR